MAAREASAPAPRWSDDLSRRVLVGHRRVVDAVRGRGTGVGLAGVGRDGPGAAVGRRQRLRHPVRRGLRACCAEHGLTHHRLSHRVGPDRARARPARPPRRSSTTARCCARPAPPASQSWVCLHHFTLPGLVLASTSTGFVDDREPHATSGPATSTSWPRPSATSCSAGSRSTSRRPTPLLGWLARRVPARASRPERFAEALEAIHLATFDAALPAARDRQAGGHRSTTCRRSSPAERLTRGRRRARPARRTCCTACWIGAVRDGVLAGAGPGPDRAARAPRRLRPDRLLVLQRATASTGRHARPLPAPTPGVGPLGYAPWSEGLGPGAAPTGRGAARPAAARRASTASAPTTTAGATTFLRESLGRGRAGRRRRHRPPRASSTGPRSTTTSGPTAYTVRLRSLRPRPRRQAQRRRSCGRGPATGHSPPTGERGSARCG